MALEPDGNDPLRNRMASQRARRDQASREGSRPFFRSLAVIGGLGWMIVLPALGGLALGRWLDTRFAGGGIFWTAPLLMIGLGLGCRLAWRKIHRP